MEKRGEIYSHGPVIVFVALIGFAVMCVREYRSVSPLAGIIINLPVKTEKWVDKTYPANQLTEMLVSKRAFLSNKNGVTATVNTELASCKSGKMAIRAKISIHTFTGEGLACEDEEMMGVIISDENEAIHGLTTRALRKALSNLEWNFKNSGGKMPLPSKEPVQVKSI